MNEFSLSELLVAAFGGGLVVKLLDILHVEVRKRFEGRISARQFVDENLDPVLKAADELVGKLRSLSNEDFRTLHRAHTPRLHQLDFLGLLYLLAKLWANIEIFRQAGLTVSITDDDRGEKFSRFMDCLESRKVRIVDRLSQRAVAELVLDRKKDRHGTIPFIEFVRLFEENDETKRWIEPVVHVLERVKHTGERQRLLLYGVVLHAMVDSLDPKHQVSRERPSFSNKLSKKSWRDLNYRVFGVYLTFVSRPQKYLGPPKRRP